MKTPSKFTTRVLAKRLLALMAGLSPAIVYSAEIVKANNADAFSSTTSWVGGVVPGASDLVVFDSSISAGTQPYFDRSFAFQGVKVVGNQAGIVIDSFDVNNSGAGPGSTAILTLGQAGFDLSSATAGTIFTFDAPTITLLRGVRQTWNVADGATLLLRSPMSSNGGAINFNLGQTGAGVIDIRGTSYPASKIFNFPATVTKADGSVNFAARGAANTVVSAETLGTSVPNPTETTAGTAVGLAGLPDGSYMDVTVSNANAANTAFNVGATINTTVGSTTGLRFAQPHTTAATNWTIGFGNSGRFQSSNPLHILVTPGVGARDVIFANGSGGHEFRFNNGSAQLILEQFNPQGTLYWRGDVSAASSTSTGSAIIKTGPGKVVWANPSFAGYASTYVVITDGVFQMGENSATGSLASTINSVVTPHPIANSGTLRLQRSDAFSFGNVLSGTGNFEVAMSGTGNATVSGNNTYTGVTKIESGVLTLGSATALGATSGLVLGGGTLAYGAGITNDFSSVPVSITGSASVDTGTNNITWAQSVGGNGGGSLAKKGAGTLTLSGANTYTGGTTVNAGELVVSNIAGSATGSGAVSLTTGSILSGNGSISGAVTAQTGSKLKRGSGAGNLTVGGLTLASGSLLDLGFSSSSTLDRVNVTNSNGLTISGGGLTLTDSATSAAWKTPGVYNLFSYSGTVQGAGASSLSVLNPQAGYSYVFGASGGFVTLEIEQDAILSAWNVNGAGSWATLTNWGNGVPASGYTAEFTTALGAPATVTLDGNRTVNGLVFNSAQPYTIASGTGGALTLNKGAKNAAVNILQGNHVVSAPVVLESNMAVSTAAGSSITLSGVVSGTGGVIKTGGGTINLNGHNTFTGAIGVTAGMVGFAYSDSLGTGAITLNGGGLRYGAGNTTDLSTRSITFGDNGGVIDTNGNDVIWINSMGAGSTGALVKAGSGILSLAVANTFAAGTTITGGTVQIDANDRLGVLAANLTFDGSTATLATSVTMSLETLSGATPVLRSIVVNAGGGALNVAAGTTLTINNNLTGTGALAKAGSGTLVLTNTTSNTTKIGGFTLRDGTLHLGTDTNFGSGLAGFIGEGTLTLEGGTITTVTTANNTLGIGNPIFVASGKSATIMTPNRFSMGGAVTGSGTLNLNITTTVTRADLSNNFADYTGALNFTGSGSVRLLNNGGGFNVGGLLGTAVNAPSTITLVAATNTNGNVFQIGSLKGAATLTNSNGGISTWQIGARGAVADVDVFSGNFAVGNAANSVTKVGLGTLTLNGATLHTGLTNVNAGTLLIDSTLPASTATAPVLPARAVTVAAAGTLGGIGVITPDTVVNGTLAPDTTAAKGGKLTFGGILELASTATTQFDFGGTVVTGVKSTLSNGVTYGGALKVNFSTVFNGSYQLFELTGTPSGAFTGVTATSTSPAASVSLADPELDGTWTGTLNGATLSFSASTGVLTVSGGVNAVLPDVPAGVVATPGNTQVSLSWNAAANATSYIVKRATTASGPYTALPATGVTSYTDTGLANGTTYYYVIQAKNAAGVSANSTEVSAVPTAVVHTALETWRFDQFGVYADDGTVLAGDLEDFDGDGLVNLQEYAFGTNPKVANASPVVVGRNGDKLTLTYPRIADAKLTYTVQGRNDLTTGSWATVDVKTGNAAGSTVVEDTALLSANPRRFLRLSVTYTP